MESTEEGDIIAFDDEAFEQNAFCIMWQQLLEDTVKLADTLARAYTFRMSLEDSVSAIDELSKTTNFKKLLDDYVIVDDFLVFGPWRGIILRLDLKSRRVELVIPP